MHLSPHCRGRRAPVIALALSLLVLPLTAQSAIVSGSLSFSATAFTPSGAPFDPIVGTVSYSFDNSAGFFNAVDGAVVNGAVVDVSVTGLNLPGSWIPVLTYFKTDPGREDVLAIGHGPTTVVTAGTDDWRFNANTISTSPGFREFWYAQASIPDVVFMTNTGTVTPVPEPQTWALLLAGMAALGASVRTRRRR